MTTAPEPGSPEHTRLVTASKAPAILGLSPWQSPYSLWQLMKGNVEPEAQNRAQSRGHYLEPAILAWWRDQHPEFADWTTQPWSPLDDWAGCTVDMIAWSDETPRDDVGLANAPGSVLVEAKSAARMDDWGTPGTDEIPDYYLAQVYFQLAVTGAARCYVPVIGPYLEFCEYVVEADPEMQEQTLAACRRFYDSLAADEPPALDSHPATFAAVKALHPEIEKGATHEMGAGEAREYVEACLALKAAEERERAVKTQLLDYMGRAQYADCKGQRIARRQPARHGVSLVRVAKSITDTEETAA